MPQKVYYSEGKKFEGTKLTFVKETKKNESNKWMALFKCDCGQDVELCIASVKSLNTSSCGCHRRETAVKNSSYERNGHGKTGTTEYVIWKSIKQRTSNPNNSGYRLYGARGITMSKEWSDSFEAFYKDMGPRPTSSHSVERKDNSVGYEKSNCRWATPKEQARNRSSNKYLEINNVIKILIVWCEEYGISHRVVLSRLKYGWDIEKALNTPIRQKVKK